MIGTASSAIARVLWNLSLYEGLPVDPRPAEQLVTYRITAYGRVAGQNPKTRYFHDKLAELSSPWKFSLLQKVYPTKSKEGFYKMKLVVEGLVADLPEAYRTRSMMESMFRSALEGLRLRGWRVYAVVCRTQRQAPSDLRLQEN